MNAARPNPPAPAPDLAAIRARAEAATPGPWRASPFDTGRPRGVCAWVIPPPEWLIDRVADCGADVPENMADAVFIAHAREDIPALLDEIDRLREALGDIAYRIGTRRTGLHMDGESQWPTPLHGEIYGIARAALAASSVAGAAAGHAADGETE